MKKKLLKIVFLLILASPSIVLNAQPAIETKTTIIKFSYDASGNRIKREIIILKELENKSGEIEDDHISILDDSKITISPNPNGGKFAVKIEGYHVENPPQITLYSINGSIIYENINGSYLNEIDISNRENGTYILQLVIGEERKTWKIIKQ